MNKILVLFVCTILITHSSCDFESEKQANKVYNKEINENTQNFVTVTDIVDGDTFSINDSSGKHATVRLIGIDAPESRKTRKENVQYYGKEAKEYLTNVLRGKKVRLEFDVDRHDPFIRTLAYAYLVDGTFVNADLVKKGYAQVMTIAPNVRNAAFFIKLQEEARKNKRGLWGAK